MNQNRKRPAAVMTRAAGEIGVAIADLNEGAADVRRSSAAKHLLGTRAN
jgi:hypothetical protein